MLPIALLVVTSVFAVYGAHLLWEWAKVNSHRATGILAALTLALATVGSTVPASAQSLSLDVDVQPFFDSINQFFPVIFPILALGGGLSAAIMLGRMLIRWFNASFSGGG